MSDQPINPVDYVPSEQAQRLIEMILDHRYQEHSSWTDTNERRFLDGNRHGLNLAFRALVELETKITDPDDLDGLCADLIQDTIDNRG